MAIPYTFKEYSCCVSSKNRGSLNRLLNKNALKRMIYIIKRITTIKTVLYERHYETGIEKLNYCNYYWKYHEISVI